MVSEPLYCPICGELVGYNQPDTYMEEGFFEPVRPGMGNIRDEENVIYCSQECLEEK